MRRHSYRGLKGLISYHGVYFSGTPFSRSLSRVFGKVSGHKPRTGWFSGRVRRRVAYARWILSRRRSVGGRTSSASSAAIGVVLNAPAIFLIACFVVVGAVGSGFSVGSTTPPHRNLRRL